MLKHMKKTIAVIFCASLCFQGIGQDVHFSQTTVAPININPAMTGLFAGNQRASLVYKDQWKSFGSGFTTYGFSFDSEINKKKWQSGYLGVGLHAFSDVAGENKLGTTKVLLSLSSILHLDDNNELSVGLQGGFAQNSINPGSMEWGDQYAAGVYNPLIQSQDQLDYTPFFYADFNAGIGWSYERGESQIRSYDIRRMEGGIAYHHVNRPSLNFAGQTEKMYSKLIVHFNGLIGMDNTNGAILPSFMVALQGPSKEIVMGAMFRIRMDEAAKITGFITEQAIAFGAHYRWKDSFIPAIWYEANKLTFGLSYDVNTSPLNVASNLRGGFEVFVRFVNPNPFYYKKLSRGRTKPSL
jgi:type IX secretion system PorP/SprF family membrane protein